MIISLTLVVLLIAAVVVLTWFSPRDENGSSSYGSDVSFLDSFSLATYRPMLRLASQLDRQFLISTHSPKLASCYRRIQRDLLREYVREASRDFNRMYAIATARAVRASSDPGDLSLSLLEEQMNFLLMVWGIEIRLMLDDYLPFAVDLQPLVASLGSLAQQSRALLRPQYSYSAL